MISFEETVGHGGTFECIAYADDASSCSYFLLSIVRRRNRKGRESGPKLVCDTRYTFCGGMLSCVLE